MFYQIGHRLILRCCIAAGRWIKEVDSLIQWVHSDHHPLFMLHVWEIQLFLYVNKIKNKINKQRAKEEENKKMNKSGIEKMYDVHP